MSFIFPSGGGGGGIRIFFLYIDGAYFSGFKILNFGIFFFLGGGRGSKKMNVFFGGRVIFVDIFKGPINVEKGLF